MSPEILRQELKDLQEDVRDNTKLTREGFDTMNGRVKKLELKQAYQEGAESATKVTLGDGGDWKKVTFKLIGLLVGIVALSSTAAGIVAQVVLK